MPLDIAGRARPVGKPSEPAFGNLAVGQGVAETAEPLWLFRNTSLYNSPMWGEVWTAEKVWIRLVEAFVRLPGTPIYSPRANVFLHGIDGEPVTALEIIGVTAWALGRDSPTRRHLLKAARCVAGGMSVEAYCSAHGLKRRTFDRWKALVMARIIAKIAPERSQNTALTLSKPELH